MNAEKVINVVVAESSVILRTGLIGVLKRLAGHRFSVVEMLSAEGLYNYIRVKQVDLLIVNPSFGGIFDVASFRKKSGSGNLKILAFVSSLTDASVFASYDGVISIFDDMQQVDEKISSLFAEEEDGLSQEPLSHREKEIVVCIAKGMTNKEIADSLFLSVHTVVTHRRNISRKLQIHSVSGLTIYAIVNKLVELKDIKNIN